jgi:hypothetical protein
VAKVTGRQKRKTEVRMRLKSRNIVKHLHPPTATLRQPLLSASLFAQRVIAWWVNCVIAVTNQVLFTCA